MARECNAHMEIDGDQLHCSGEWILDNIFDLRKLFAKLSQHFQSIDHVQVSDIKLMDSAGALVLEEVVSSLLAQGKDVHLEGLNERYRGLVDMIAVQTTAIHQSLKPEEIPNWFHRVGEWAYDKLEQFLSFFSFLGECCFVIFEVLKRPKSISLRSLISLMQSEGARAMPIVGLMSFLIGVVLTYQMGAQLKNYGANIFIVNVAGIAILREFGPLITAIVMAGRTSTAFASLIGTMGVNEEIDALAVMGKNAITTLVVPRGLALLITFPLLTVFADLMSILGSMVMSKAALGINYPSYIERFSSVVSLRHYVLGMIKAPFFALIISIVGCFQGLNVKMSAESVGIQTTKAAVQSIFLIIVADAFFSILYSIIGV